MKLEDQVSSREPSERLKELGVKQESHFWWGHWDFAPDSPFVWDGSADGNTEDDTKIKRCSAFTVAELGEMLPRIDFCFEKYNSKRWEFWFDGKYEGRKQFQDCTEADARAKMLIYLIENKLVKP